MMVIAYNIDIIKKCQKYERIVTYEKANNDINDDDNICRICIK